MFPKRQPHQRTNVIPMQMGYDEMLDGYRSLYWRLVPDHEIAERIQNKVGFFSPVVRHTSRSVRTQLAILLRLFLRGVLPGGLSRVFHFLRSLPLSRPSLISVAAGDWIVALTIRDFVERHLGAEPS